MCSEKKEKVNITKRTEIKNPSAFFGAEKALKTPVQLGVGKILRELSERKGAEIIEAEGAQKIIAADYHLSTPAVVTDAITVYRANNDWLNIFLEECCDLGDNRSQKSGRLYEKYREYCQQTGEYARSTTDFYAALEAAGYSRKVTSTGKIILGLSLKDNLFS